MNSVTFSLTKDKLSHIIVHSGNCSETFECVLRVRTEYWNVNVNMCFLFQSLLQGNIQIIIITGAFTQFKKHTTSSNSSPKGHGPINHGLATAFFCYRVTLNARYMRDYLRGLIIWACRPFCFTELQDGNFIHFILYIKFMNLLSVNVCCNHQIFPSIFHKQKTS